MSLTMPASLSPTHTGPARLPALKAILGAWLVIGALMSALYLNAYRPFSDPDDFLKLHEIRHVLDSGSLLDRQLPNILQPEPFISHWSWISDAPYVLIALLARPFLGAEAAVQTAVFIAPLLLFLVALVLVYKTAVRLGFADPGLVTAVASVSITFLEFQPGRVDYHNIQLLLLAGMVLAVAAGGRKAAALCGLLGALSFSISAELAFHVALVMAIYAGRFVFSAKESAEEIADYGLSLLVASTVLLFAVNPTGPWFGQLCDRYSLAHLFALGGAGATFAVAGTLLGSRHWAVKAAALGVGALGAVALVVTVFPQCLGGPYAAMSRYSFENFIAPIAQEKSFFALDAPPLVLTLSVLSTLFSSVIVVAAVACGSVRTRAWLVLALFAALGVVLGLAYTRYMRFAPMAGWPGVVLLAASCMSAGSIIKVRLTSNQFRFAPGFKTLFLPVVGLGAIMGGAAIIHPAPKAEFLGADIAGFCAKVKPVIRSWPAGATVLGPPLITNTFLNPGGPNVVAVPFHTASPGLERTYRFFDPATANPRQWLDQSKANLVVACAHDDIKSATIRREFPFTVSLLGGTPPDWLKLCPAGKNDPLRIYAYGENAACPAPVNIDEQSL